MLSMLLQEIGWAIYSHQWFWNSWGWALGGIVVIAGVLGAPLAVPISLAVRLRNTWIALPLIAVAAAIGIEVQEQIGTLLQESASSFSQMLDIVWIVPAVFGTAAAFLVKWRQRSCYAAILIIAVLAPLLAVAGSKHTALLNVAYAAAESWSTLRAGMGVYTGGYADGQRVCPTLKVLLANSNSLRCKSIARGAAATVEQIFPCKRSDPGGEWPSTDVRIRAHDGTWQGYTDYESLQPEIPAGTILSMSGDWSTPLSLGDSAGNLTNIGSSAIVKLLRYEPRKDRSLYVRVLSGWFRGRMGWMAIEEVDTGRVASGTCEPSY